MWLVTGESRVGIGAVEDGREGVASVVEPPLAGVAGGCAGHAWARDHRAGVDRMAAVVIYAEMGHPVGVYGGAATFLGASVEVEVHGAGDAGAGEVGVRVVAGGEVVVGGHFAFCAVGQLGVGRVLGGWVRAAGGGAETYCDGVATGGVIAVVVAAGVMVGGRGWTGVVWTGGGGAGETGRSGDGLWEIEVAIEGGGAEELADLAGCGLGGRGVAEDVVGGGAGGGGGGGERGRAAGGAGMEGRVGEGAPPVLLEVVEGGQGERRLCGHGEKRRLGRRYTTRRAWSSGTHVATPCMVILLQPCPHHPPLLLAKPDRPRIPQAIPRAPSPPHTPPLLRVVHQHHVPHPRDVVHEHTPLRHQRRRREHPPQRLHHPSLIRHASTEALAR